MATNAALSQEITEYIADSTPEHVEMSLDKYHPNNSEFFKQLSTFKRLIVTQSRKMKPLHVNVAKAILKGQKNTTIAEDLHIVPGTVSGIKRREDVKELTALLYHLTTLNEGPSLEHRKRVLFEIVVDNQYLDPKTSIAGIQEMNRMDGVGKDKLDTQINVTINNEVLPRGALDK